MLYTESGGCEPIPNESVNRGLFQAVISDALIVPPSPAKTHNREKSYYICLEG